MSNENEPELLKVDPSTMPWGDGFIDEDYLDELAGYGLVQDNTPNPEPVKRRLRARSKDSRN